MGDYVLVTTLTDETRGYVWCEDEYKLEPGWTLDDDEKPSWGLLYKLSQREYGRCQSSVYVDTDDGVKRVGWFFVSRQQYEDTNEPYLRGAWVTVAERTITPTRYDYAEVGT